MNSIDLQNIINTKEIHSFELVKNVQDLPEDVFNIISDEIIQEILYPDSTKITKLRNHLYDLLIYSVDVSECIWYILTFCIENRLFKNDKDITDTLNQTFIFFKYYNNNYRSIYHLESIIIYILNKIHFSK